MSYNSVGGITQKTQLHKRKDQEQKKTTYDLNYTYGEEQPHAPIHIGDQTYSYEANGNQTGWTDDKTGQRRNIMWDEENRIRSIYDNGSQHHYIYDASGERVLKGKSTGQRIFVNGEWKAGSGGMGNYTVYVNPYLVLKSGGYSKHYYIEGQRIVSKLGGGWDNTKNIKAGGDKVDYNGKTQRLFDGIVKNLKFLGADGQILTAGKSGKVPPGQLNGTATGNVSEAFRYFYHPDHLGSTSYVTDASGEVYQHLEYFAFGEVFVEEHSNTDRTPYLFNGKELDEETGLYYYGARYMDPRTSVWLSVDPLAEKYPAITPFAYVNNNPVVFIDPDGKKIDLSGLSASDRKAYDAMISKLSNSKIFRAYYKRLEGSETTYFIKPGSGHGGSGSYNGKTKEVHSTQNPQVLAQELFHAYQDDLGVYTDKDMSVREAEGDLVSASVALSIEESSMSYSDWDQGIQFEYVDENLEFDKKVLSGEFDEDFNEAVDARIEFYKKREQETGAKAPEGYVQKNSKVGALALKAVVTEVNSEEK